jgi:hypothetical protein
MFFLLLPTLYVAFRREARDAPSSSPPAVQRTLTLTNAAMELCGRRPHSYLIALQLG